MNKNCFLDILYVLNEKIFLVLSLFKEFKEFGLIGNWSSRIFLFYFSFSIKILLYSDDILSIK